MKSLILLLPLCQAADTPPPGGDILLLSFMARSVQGDAGLASAKLQLPAPDYTMAGTTDPVKFGGTWERIYQTPAGRTELDHSFAWLAENGIPIRSHYLIQEAMAHPRDSHQRRPRNHPLARLQGDLSSQRQRRKAHRGLAARDTTSPGESCHALTPPAHRAASLGGFFQ